MMAVARLVFLLVSTATAIAPTEKVVQMLAALETETKAELAEEKTNFGKYSAWCESNTGKTMTTIQNGEDAEKKTVSKIEEQSSEYEQKQSELQKMRSSKEQLAAEKLANDQQCSKDRSTYDATKADLDKAVASLQAAIEKLNTAQGTSLLQFGSRLQQSLDLAEAMGFLQEPKHKVIAAFLQGGQGAKAEPWLAKEGEEFNKSKYGFQSGGIVEILKDLETQFTGERDGVVAEWKATKAACESTKASKDSAISGTSTSISDTEKSSAAVKIELSDAKKALQETKKTLRDARAYLQDVQEDCAARTADFGQRSKNREGEIEAIQSALEVMKTFDASVSDASLLSVSAHAMVRQAPSASFIQQRSLRGAYQHHMATQSKTQSISAHLAQAEAQSIKARTAQAIGLLSKAGVSLKSSRLPGLALRMKQVPNSDPLQFVKQMTQDMIDNLLNESTMAQSQQGLCDTQMMKASKERDRRFRESTSLDKKMKVLDTKREELLETIDLQKSSTQDMEAELANAMELRTNESAANIKTISEATAGTKAVGGAIAALKSFYAKADRSANRYDEAASFLQQASKEDPSAGFEGSYAGKQNKALGIVTMMEVIRDDFKRTAKETKEEEDDAADKFTKLKSESKVDIESKKTSMTLSEEDLEVTINELASGKESLKSTVKLLDTALETLEDLKDKCISNQMTYEQRKEKRMEEILQLKQAMCILDTANVEPDCQTNSKVNR